MLNIRGEKVSEEALALALQDAADVAGKTLGATAEFAASAEFQGSREGSHFGTGDKGLGHYRDVTAGLNAPVSPPAILDYTACEPVLLDRSRGASRSWLIPAKWAGSAPGYTLFVEYEETRGSPGGEAGQLRLDSSSLDKALRERSPVYGSFRDKGSIGEVHVVEVSSGSFAGLRERWLRERGATPNQQKVPRVLRDERAAEYLWSHRK